MLSNLLSRRFSAATLSTFVLLASTALAGCASLPTNGPTGAQVRKDARSPDNAIGYNIITVTSANVPTFATDPSAPTMASLAATGETDVLGPGDVLSIEIYEVGAGLFSGGRTMLGNTTGEDLASMAPSANGGGLGDGLTVDRNGMISVPYIGKILVAGLTTMQVQDRIVAGLKGKSQSPQVIVTLRKNIASTVVVMGAVTKTGRLDLTLAHERLLDAIAESGGISLAANTGNSTATGTGPQDMVVRLTRGGRTVEQPLDEIVSGSADDILLLPGDRVNVVRQPRTFTMFGAIDRISQIPFESRRVSLAEALARAGGPADARADPRSVFVFRLLSPPDVPNAKPSAVIYRLDMMHASSYFTAQQFAMRDKDVIYVANASSNQPSKLAQILGQLFSPILAVRAVAN